MSLKLLSSLAIVLPLLLPIGNAFAQSDKLQEDAQKALPVFQSVFAWLSDTSEHIMGAIFGIANVHPDGWIISAAAFILALVLVLTFVKKILIKHLGYALLASVIIVAIVFFVPWIKM